MKTYCKLAYATVRVARCIPHPLESLLGVDRIFFGLLAFLIVQPFAAVGQSAPPAAAGPTEVVAPPAKPVSPVMTLHALKRVVAKDKAGKTTESLVEFTKVLPGEEVVYIVTTTNPGTVAVTDIAVTLPVPPEMTYSEGSAEKAGTLVTFSVDGGKTFAATDKLLVVAPDGASRPGLIEDINTVRWLITQPLAPGASIEVRCRATLK